MPAVGDQKAPIHDAETVRNAEAPRCVASLGHGANEPSIAIEFCYVKRAVTIGYEQTIVAQKGYIGGDKRRPGAAIFRQANRITAAPD